MSRLVALAVLVGAAVGLGGLNWQSLLALVVVLAILFVYLLYQQQDKLLYQPRAFPEYIRPSQNPEPYRSPADMNLSFQNVYLRTADNLKLHAWHILQPEPLRCPTLLYFQGNAANMGFCLPNIAQFYLGLKVNIFVLSYRGYGESEGEPREQGLMLDAETAMRHLLSDTARVDPARIVVFGRSLGGAVALSLTNSFLPHIRGFILENTFTCISDMVDNIFPYLKPLKSFILQIDWPSIKRIGAVQQPILFLAAQMDEIVPSSHMERLFRAARHSKRTFARFPLGTHNDTWIKTGYLDVVSQWLLTVFPDHTSPTSYDIWRGQQAVSDAMRMAAAHGVPLDHPGDPLPAHPDISLGRVLANS